MIGLATVTGSTRRADGTGQVTDLVDGAIAGAVGSVALNVVTYLDITIRGRPPSSTPEESARRLTGVLHVGLGPEDRAANRRSGLGPLLGYALGVGCGAALTVVGLRRLPGPVAAGILGASAMLASDGMLTVLRVTDPRRWSATDWLSDVVPHLAYGMAAVATLGQLGRSRPPDRRFPLRARIHPD